MPESRKSGTHRTRPLWSLLEDALVEPGSDGGDVVVRGRWGAIKVAGRGPMVHEALNRMCLGPVALENISSLYGDFLGWRLGYTAPCAQWDSLRRTLDQLGGYVIPSLGRMDDGGLLLSAIPVVPHAVFVLPQVHKTALIRLRPETTMQDIAREQTLVCPQAPYQVVLHHATARAVATALLETGVYSVQGLAGSLRLDPRLVTDIVSYLIGARVVLPELP